MNAPEWEALLTLEADLRPTCEICGTRDSDAWNMVLAADGFHHSCGDCGVTPFEWRYDLEDL